MSESSAINGSESENDRRYKTRERRIRRTFTCLAVLLLLASSCSGGDDEATESVATEGSSPVEDADTSRDGSDEASSSEAVETGTESASSEDAPVTRSPGDDVSVAPGSWTFMVYLVGDNDLEPFALQDLAEMASVGSQDEMNIIALVDRSADYTDEGVVDQQDWETAKVFQVLPDSLNEIADLGEINMGDPRTLGQFIVDATAIFPAENYALSIWNHGGGWTGIGPDETDLDVLELAELVEGLTVGLEVAGVPRLDLLGFDACLMATYEVASALAPVTEYFLASQELEPGHGWDYSSLAVLVDDPTTDGAGLGRALIDGFDAYARNNGTAQDITLSLIDTAAMPALDEAMGAFAELLTDQVEFLAPAAGRQRAQTLEFGRSENPGESTQLADLGVFVSELGVQSLQVSDEADAVLRALNDAVIERTAGPARLGATGLSIYFPPNERLYDGAYPVEQVEAAAQWGRFLSAYHGAGAAIPPEEQAAFADADAPLEIFDVEGGVEVEAAFDPDSLVNLVDAFITYGIVDDETGDVILLGDDDALIADDGSGLVVGFSDLTQFIISDGEDSLPAYLGVTTDEDSGLSTASIPLDYFAPDDDEFQSVELSIVIDFETGDILEETIFIVDEAGTWGELLPDPEGLLVPVLPTFGADGTEEWIAIDGAVYADLALLEYSIEPIEAGTEIYVELGIEDFGGNVASVAASFDS